MRGVSAKCVDEYVATVCERFRVALWDAQVQLMAEAQRQKWYYGQKIGTVDLKPGNLVLLKANTFKVKRKIKYRSENTLCEGGASDHGQCPIL